MNTQPIEKQSHANDGSLDVHSIFYTIQGEGPFVGVPAVFVRLAGCNLQCPLCDTDYTSKRLNMTPRQILEEIVKQKSAADLVVITGGEPFRQNITDLVLLLRSAELIVQIETNGTLSPDEDFPFDDSGVVIVCSPKTGKLNANLMPHINALKYVVRFGETAADGLPLRALAHPAAPVLARPPADFEGEVFIQPADEKELSLNTANMHTAVNLSMQHGYVLGVQLHKIIGKE